MKKIIFLTIALLATPLSASLNCLDNSQHLQQGNYDYKKWHSVKCYCPCTYVKGRECVECGHLQNARPLIIVKNPISKLTQSDRIQEPQTVRETLKHLVREYLKTH